MSDNNIKNNTNGYKVKPSHFNNIKINTNSYKVKPFHFNASSRASVQIFNINSRSQTDFSNFVMPPFLFQPFSNNVYNRSEKNNYSNYVNEINNINKEKPPTYTHQIDKNLIQTLVLLNLLMARTNTQLRQRYTSNLPKDNAASRSFQPPFGGEAKDFRGSKSKPSTYPRQDKARSKSAQKPDGHGKDTVSTAEKELLQAAGLWDSFNQQDENHQKKINVAYKKLARKYHPDKGGDKAKFQDLNNAYEKYK